MRKSRYTDEQVAFALKQAERGTPVAAASRFSALFAQTAEAVRLPSPQYIGERLPSLSTREHGLRAQF